ncbi:hypothetical protein M0802_009801 [Mischocyttarus mexicanus]|nr:hypothetical protein M0802_009801 [Mischocyttarus mexicanus]
MQKTLNDSNLKPSNVTYIEADGTAVKNLDREELKAIDLIYEKDRSPSNPLLIGSVKSNINTHSYGDGQYTLRIFITISHRKMQNVFKMVA